ncbi:helix-turn-helix domain-containing protein [Streptomyces sp. NPDC048603]|uniref:helix-turn-helix domain-containing protein n=1 Tax=Streptomyces sp. NPDC048603 TaxID=3365577 RepID=UPI00370FAC17
MTQSVDTAAGPAALPSPKERRRLREAAELTHDEIAAALGITASTVRAWETGRAEPRGRKRQAYAKFLGELRKQVGEADDQPDEGDGAATAEAPATGAEAPAAEAAAAGRHAPRVAGAVRAFAKSDGGPAGTRPGPAAKTSAEPAPKPPASGAGSVRGTTTGLGIFSGRARKNPENPRGAASGAGTAAGAGPAAASGAAPGYTAETTAGAGTGAGAGAAAGTPAGAASSAAPGAGHRPAQDSPPDPDAPGPPAAANPLTPVPVPAPVPAPDAGHTADTAFEALYDYTAPALLRQVYLLTGRRALALEAVERAFQLAWDRWPQVATDPDPVGWVRSAAYEHALSPWHRFRRAHRHPDRAPADLGDRALLDAMLALPPSYRRTVLLYDGVGLDLPDTAAETEASTSSAGHRLLHAHAGLTARLPDLAGVAADRQSALLRERLGALVPAVRLEPRPAQVVRLAGEHRMRFWTRAALCLTAAIAVATAYTAVTAPTRYVPPVAPGTSVSGVPPRHGPQQLSEQARQLQEKLRSEPAAGPARLVPRME